MTPTDLSQSERELLRLLASEQARYEAREGWDFRHTLWSRVSYLMAKARGRLSPTHIPGKFDLDRQFEVTFRRLVDRLIKRKLVRKRAIGTGTQPRQTLGYKSHEARGRDLFLTEAGKTLAASLEAARRPAPDGDIGSPAPDGRGDIPPPSGGASLPKPDGDSGFPAPDGDNGFPAPDGDSGPRASEGERPPPPISAHQSAPPSTTAPGGAQAPPPPRVLLGPPTPTPSPTSGPSAPPRPRRLTRPRAQRPARRPPPRRSRRSHNS